jgi:polyferredoxin
MRPLDAGLFAASDFNPWRLLCIRVPVFIRALLFLLCSNSMIDLTDRLIQTTTLLRAPNGSAKRHAPRRLLQLLCGVLLVALPLTNGLRLDLRRDEFYFAWHKMAAHDLYLLFWVSMLGVALLSAVSFLYGRFWCGWVCPQTLASDFADSLRTRLDKALRTRPGKPRFGLSRSLWALGVLGMSLGTGVILACYWLAPKTVFAATAAPWRDLSAGLTVYLSAAVVAADMLWVRRKFCASGCPYGPLMSVLSDQNTLAVRYLDERDDDCIHCHRCEVDCPMGIDIKQGVGQLSCIGCGECIDSCNDVLGKRGKAGLIEFRYGTQPERLPATLSLFQKLGLWDGRRWMVAATVPVCLAVVLFLIFGSWPLGASVNARGEITRTAAEVRNGYLLTLSSGLPTNAPFTLSVTGLPSGRIEPAQVEVGAHESRTVSITVIGPTTSLALGRTPIHLRVFHKGDSKELSTIFYTPRPNESQ